MVISPEFIVKGIFSAQFCQIPRSQWFPSNNITEKHYSSQALVSHKQENGRKAQNSLLSSYSESLGLYSNCGIKP